MKVFPLLGLLLLCSLIWPTISLAQTPSKGIVLSISQAEVIGTSLQKFEALKISYGQQRVLNKELATKNSLLTSKVIALDSAYTNSQVAYTATKVLYEDSKLSATKWQAKARKRNLKFFAALGVIALILVSGIGH